MEILPGVNIDISVSLIVGVLVKMCMLLLLLLSIIMIRQEVLMDRVVNLPMGSTLKTVVWVFFVMTLILTTIVVIA